MDYFDMLARVPNALFDSYLGRDTRKKMEYLFGNVDIFGFKPFQAGEQYRYMDDYLRQRGLTWSDMKYPSLARGAGSMGGMLNGSTRAISRLYQDSGGTDRAYRAGRKDGFNHGWERGYNRRTYGMW